MDIYTKNPYLSEVKSIDAILLPWNYQANILNDSTIRYSFTSELFEDTPFLRQLFIEELANQLSNNLIVNRKFERVFSSIEKNITSEAVNIEDLKDFDTALKRGNYELINSYIAESKQSYYKNLFLMNMRDSGVSSQDAYHIQIASTVKDLNDIINDNILGNYTRTKLLDIGIENFDVNEELLSKIFNYILSNLNPLIDRNYLNSPKDILMMKQALESWQNIANISFVEDNTSPEFKISISYDNDYYEYKEEESSNGFGDCAYHDHNIDHCNFPIFYHQDLNTNEDEHLRLYIHELGHGLGLAHPFDGEITLDGIEATSAITVMAYGPMVNIVDKDGVEIYPSSPMLYDIQAIQYLYGANTEFHKDDDIYKINGERKLFCIWDAGGVDTIDTTQYNGNARIDLRAGYQHQNKVGDSYFYIAFDANIENVATGDGDDVIYGNHLSNTISPGKGNNIIYSGAASNKFIFEGGNDTIKDFKKNDQISISMDLVQDFLDLSKNITFGDNNIVIDFGNSGFIELELAGELTSTSFTSENISFF